jgi:hypothetical protein
MVDTVPTRIRNAAAKVSDRFNPITSAYKQLESLTATLVELPPEQCCYACGGPTTKALIDYEYDCSASDGSRITLAKALPGYRCVTCSAEYRDGALSERFLAILATAFATAGETRLQEALERRSSDPRMVVATTDLEPRQPA